jgi:hypothetical protein
MADQVHSGAEKGAALSHERAAHQEEGRARLLRVAMKVKIVEPDGVGCLLVVSVLLIVDGHAIPRRRAWGPRSS